VYKLANPSLIVRNAVIVYPASDNANDGIQGLPFI